MSNKLISVVNTEIKYQLKLARFSSTAYIQRGIPMWRLGFLQQQFCSLMGDKSPQED